MSDQDNSVVRRFRRRAGLTQEELAQRSGVSVRTIRGLETGNRRNPQLTSVRQLADAMDLAPDDRDELMAAVLGGDTATAGATPLPRQLPAAPAGFTGRETELVVLSRAVDATTATTATTVVITAVAGAGGIGKTWLALHWAHHHLDRFPDGQLFVDLRGFSPDGDPVDPLTVLRGFLDAIGIDPAGVTGGVAEHSARYRSEVAGKRVLIVLDNAGSAGQVIPLLPGTPTCVVVITSRKTLTELLQRHGARHLSLTVLDKEEAYALLALRVGDERLAAEPDAVTELIRSCGGYPLALAVVAGRAHIHPNTLLAEFAAELRDLGLDALDDANPTASLPAVLSWSMRALTTEQRLAFGLLGIAPGADIGLPAAASLTALSLPRARLVLRALEETSLLHRQGHDRYSMHDLIRDHAASTAHQHLPADTRQMALLRLIEFYLRTARAADMLLEPMHSPSPLDERGPGCEPFPLTTRVEAGEWFAAELPNLLAAQRLAVEQGWRKAVWQFAWSLDIILRRQGRTRDRLATWRAGLAAVDHDDPPEVHVEIHENLGHAAAYVGLRDEATKNLKHALTLAEQTCDVGSQARIHVALAQAYGQHNLPHAALNHATSALRLHQDIDLPMAKAIALNSVGWYNARLGRYDQARIHCEAALLLARRVRHPDIEADILDSLGYIANHTGNHHDAVEHYRSALGLYRAASADYYFADTLGRLGHAYYALGRFEQTRMVWLEALEFFRQQGRDEDAEQVRRQLDDLDNPGAATDSNN